MGHIVFKTVVSAMLVVISACSQGQTSTPKSKKIYRAEVHQSQGNKSSGILYRVDSARVVLAVVHKKSKNDTVFSAFSSSDIVKIKVRKKKAIAVGFGVGAAIGAVVGYSIGYSTYTCDDSEGYGICFPGLAGLEAAMVGILLGGTMGATIGGINKKFQVNNSLETYRLNLPKLQKYAYR